MPKVQTVSAFGPTSLLNLAFLSNKQCKRTRIHAHVSTARKGVYGIAHCIPRARVHGAVRQEHPLPSVSSLKAVAS